ncbi:DUF2637 domain-containing protein [Amycolatopsis cynarae]|uniref:DUF2637 domain-containing protein n=1 Tax=Amycolatopsis cynarae TaxID=2995223 RepID=A0ABY7B4X5_9PSEU|nr:DUF2637 domain-containing protein [Amycolatopsis sp. HUAS 11-8]WAL66708.1 DUF2637 domain-containing protein [Amycolatopsis sp. HUAS 11-8]
MTVANRQLMAKVRQAQEAARQAGQPAPGRPTLVKLTGATDHAVRTVLTEMAAENGRAGVSAANQDRHAGERSVREPSVDVETHPDPSGQTATALATAGDAVSPVVDEIAMPGERTPKLAPTGGRLVAWAGFVFGSVMSIAANVLHAWLPATDEPPGWSPGLAPQIGAAVWPVGLMLAVEALSRTAWPKGFLWSLARFGGAGAVAMGSAVISYGHLRGLLLAWHYGPPAAAVGPLVLDGLMVVCGFALLAMSRPRAGEAGGDRR